MTVKPATTDEEPGLFASFMQLMPTPTDRAEALVMLAIAAALTTCISLVML
ncbi:hypothetical protein [Niveispirillum sp. BGYR6]|uniref:hypothetical protein n=1 Tax=Niveispirillum sp. BGYR6 TaxID=2971249 RepID=UPI0022B968A7|nr:hypothetical protein [Niveispirillum sp. BGYR6]MDG5494847.1 hypothetical protein [Niveispirillum sp. BGYR6]